MLVIYVTSIILGSLVSFFAITPKHVVASTNYDWSLNTSTDYTYDSDEVQFDGVIVKPSRDLYLTDATIYGTHCIDTDSCYFVGSGGVIFKTDDGGTSFQTQTSGTSYDLKSISCKTNAGVDICYVAGNSGTILKTENNGTTWSGQTSTTTNNLNGIHFIDDTVGYAVGDGGKILITVNGGTSWLAQTSGVTVNFKGVYFTDANNGYVVGEAGNVLKTLNGGTNWSKKIWGWGGWVFNAISCTSTNICYAAGTNGTQGRVLKTTDGFTSYTSQATGLSNTYYGIYFTDANNGYVVGANRLILKTTNGGTNWTTLVSDTDFNLYSINCTDSDYCYVAGSNYMLKTINSGGEWLTLSHYPPKPSVVPNISKEYNVILSFTQTLGAGSTGIVYYQVSNDNGATWYYLNGSNVWTATTSDDNRSTAAQVNTYISSFTGGYGSGTGQFKWKAIFYVTSGTQQQKLDNVQVSIKESPNPPQELRVADASKRDKEVWLLALTWDAPVANESEIDYYKIERSDDGGPWTAVGTTADETRRAYAEIVPSPSVTYFYRVRAVDHDDIGGLYNDESDVSNVVSLMPTGKYPTPPTLLGNPSASAGATTATITWSTDRVSSSGVKYGVDTSYGSVTGATDTNVTSHTVTLRGLAPGTTYHYKLQSLDQERTYGDDVYYPSDYTFTTSQTAEISGLKVTDIRADSVLLSWQTTSDMTSTIHYGETKQYGRTVESGGGLSHSSFLTSLQDGTTYHLKIVGNDSTGNLIQSDDYSFETLALPKLTNVKFDQIKDKPSSTVKVTWDSNVPASSIVEYTDGTGKKEAMSDYQLLTKHEITLSGLQDRTEYIVTVKGRDGLGNEATSETHKITTDLDTRPPEISEITTEKSIEGYGAGAKAQLIVSWTTDEPSTSQVEYEEAGSGKKLSLSTYEDSSLSTSHAVVMSNLKPSTSYYFRIVTKDKAKNETKSEINSVLTGQARLSIFDVIVKSFGASLGWLLGGTR
jgi:photosystem II stability/assembly factor-like uncharacterized protein